jgi:hypothetical protein
MSEENNDNPQDDNSQDDNPPLDSGNTEDAAADPLAEAGNEEQVPTANTESFDLGVLIDVARQVITKPADFYRGMDKSGGFQKPLIFVLVMAVAMALLTTVLSFAGLGQVGAMAVGITTLIVMPIAAIIGSFIGAAIMFVIWKLMGSDEDYETAYRCVAYAAAIFPITSVIGIVPYIGSIVSIVWWMYLMTIASTLVHARREQTAFAVFGILGAILVMTNISGERQARRMQAEFEGMSETLGESFGGALEGMEDMSPEERGQAMGEFLRGLQEAVEDEQNQDE